MNLQWIFYENNIENNQEKISKSQPTQPSSTSSEGGSAEGSGSSSGGSGGSSSSSETSSTQECFFQQISYALKNFKQEFHPDSTICSLEVYNLDYETSGDFKIRFILEGQEQITSGFLNPRTNKTFEASFNFQSESSCSYNTILIPKKQIC